MSERVWDFCFPLGFFLVVIIAFCGGWWARDASADLRDPERLWEGSAEWVAVKAIEDDNIILKHRLDSIQAHYDSMVCYRP